MCGHQLRDKRILVGGPELAIDANRAIKFSFFTTPDMGCDPSVKSYRHGLIPKGQYFFLTHC